MMHLLVVNSKPYHGCKRLNRSSTQRLIDWKQGERCLIPTNTGAGDLLKKNIYVKNIIRSGTGRDSTKKLKICLRKISRRLFTIH